MLAPRTEREQILLTAAAAVFLLLGLFSWRLRPAWAELRALTTEAAAARQQASELALPPPPPDDPARLAREISKCEEELARYQMLAQVHRGQFAAGETDREALHVEMTELAQVCGVRIKERKPLADSRSMPAAARTTTAGGTSSAGSGAVKAAVLLELPEGPFLDGALLADHFDRTLEQMTVEASFAGLHRFLVGLDRLSWRVVVVRWSVETNRASAGAGGPARLQAKLVVAL